MNPREQRRLAALRLAAIRKQDSDSQYASLADLQAMDATRAKAEDLKGEPRYDWLQAQMPRTPKYAWGGDSAIRRGELPRTVTIDPAQYAKSIYGEKDQEVLATSRKYGGKPNLSPVQVTYEYSPAVDSDDTRYIGRGGEYTYDPPAVTTFGRSPRQLASTNAHELAHHMNAAEPWLGAKNLGPRANLYSFDKPGDQRFHDLPEVTASAFGRYVGSPRELQARVIRRIKHWGAERGIIPRDENEAKSLLERFGREVVPTIPREHDRGKSEWHEQQMLPRVILHPFAPLQILQTVIAPSMRQIAAQRLAKLRNGDA